jgi:hypothetical protein
MQFEVSISRDCDKTCEKTPSVFAFLRCCCIHINIIHCFPAEGLPRFPFHGLFSTFDGLVSTISEKLCCNTTLTNLEPHNDYHHPRASCNAGLAELLQRNKKVQHLPFLHNQIKTCLILVQLSAEADNWSAQSVLISGATGSLANAINGIFDPTAEVHDYRIRYCKRGDASVWIEHSYDASQSVHSHAYIRAKHYWQFVTTPHKGTDKVLLQIESRGRALEACNPLHCSERIIVNGSDVWAPVYGITLVLQKDAEIQVQIQ